MRGDTGHPVKVAEHWATQLEVLPSAYRLPNIMEDIGECCRTSSNRQAIATGVHNRPVCELSRRTRTAPFLTVSQVSMRP